MGWPNVAAGRQGSRRAWASHASAQGRQLLKALAAVPVWIWAIAALALTLRLLMVGYGLPYELDPDESLFVDAAWRMIEGGTLDPGWYSHPASPLLDILAALYGVHSLVGIIGGAFGSVAEAGDAYRADISQFFLIGRVVIAVCGSVVVVMTYLVARELRVSAFWAAVAAVIVTLSFPMIEFSSIVRSDMPVAMFLLAIVLVMLRALDRPSGTSFAVAGALLGLAVTSKYPGGMGVIPIVVANMTLVFGRTITPRRGLIWLAGAAATALAVAVAVAPYLFIHYEETLTALRIEATPYKLGATGEGFSDNALRYLTEALPWAIGIAATIISVAGLTFMLVFRRARVVTLTFWAYLVALSTRGIWWFRWALPLVPLASIGIAVLLDRVDSWLSKRLRDRWRTLTRVTAAALLVVPAVVPTVATIGAHAVNDDTRIRAIEWVHRNVPDGSTLLVDSYTPQVSSGRYDVVVVKGGRLMRWQDDERRKLRPSGYVGIMTTEWAGTPDELLDSVRAEGVDYIFLTDLWIELLQREADAYPGQLAAYETLLDEFPVVEVFDRQDASLGPTIMILDATSQAGEPHAP